jgi:hypothetical protein
LAGCQSGARGGCAIDRLTLVSLLVAILGLTLILMGVNEHARGPRSRKHKALDIILSGYAFLGAIFVAISIVLYGGPHS